MITLDTSSQGTLVNPGTSQTFSHTCTGNNLILFVGVFGDNQSSDATGNKIAGVTYNGVAMVEINRTYVAGDRWTYLYYLLNPATGANNIVVSTDGNSIAIQSWGSSYAGVKQLDNSITKQQSGINANTDYTTTLSTIADNCWTIMVIKEATGTTATASSGCVIRKSANGNDLFDSNGPSTPPGSKSMAAQSTNSGNWASVMASFAPLNSSNFSFLFK